MAMSPSKAHVWRSYCKGATPENQYKVESIEDIELMPHGDMNWKPFVDRDEGAFCKFAIRSNGADLPRYVTMEKDDRGEWRMYEFSSLCLGVRPPVDPNEGDF